MDISKVQDLAFGFNAFILSVFNKEGIAIFCFFCVMIFAMASMAAIWAMQSGQFKDVEAAKFEMLED